MLFHCLVHQIEQWKNQEQKYTMALGGHQMTKNDTTINHKQDMGETRYEV
jgi:hypothetical protein